MEFDIRTILLLLFLVSALLALMLLIFWKTQKTYYGFRLWTLGSILATLGYLLIMLRGTVPVLLSVLIANLVLVTSVLYRVDGITRLTRSKPLPLIVYGLLIPFLIIFLYFTYVYDSIPIRALVLGAVIVPALLAAGIIAGVSGERKNRYINYAFATILILNALFYTVRVVYWFFVTEPASIFSADQFNSIYFILTLLVDILATGFFLMLNMVRSQSELAASEERYRMLSDNLPDYVVVHDGVSILYANPATRHFTGRPAEEVAGLPIASFLAMESRAESDEVLQLLRTDPGSVNPHEIVIQSLDGSRRHCIIRSVPLRYQEQDAFLSVLTDITERKRIEDSLRVANRKLNLLSGITRHDIKNQLMALNSYLFLASDAIHEPEKLKEYFARELKITETIGRQIDFTRDYEILGVNSPVWQDVSSIVQAAGSALPMQDVTLMITCPDLEIFADPLLEKVFYNLIDNSLRYGGSKMTAIHITMDEPGDNSRIIYEDDGNGVSTEDKKKLFVKGFGKNTGLGLFLSQEILSITGIAISETGEPGKGARFEIVVPKGGYRIAGTR